MIREKHTRLIARSLPNSQLEILPGDHFIARTNPEGFRRAVEAFFADIMPRAIEKRDWEKDAEGCPPNSKGFFDWFGAQARPPVLFGLFEKMRSSA